MGDKVRAGGSGTSIEPTWKDKLRQMAKKAQQPKKKMTTIPKQHTSGFDPTPARIVK